MANPDFVSRNLGSIVILTPLTDAAHEWAADNLATDPDLPAVNIDLRYFLAIARGLLNDGLTMQDGATGRMTQLPEVY